MGRITSDPEGWGRAWVKKWARHWGQAPYSPPTLTLTLPISLCSLFQILAWLWSSSQVWGAHRKLLVSGNCPSDSWPSFKTEKPHSLTVTLCCLHVSTTPSFYPVHTNRRQPGTVYRSPESLQLVRQSKRVWSKVSD